MKYRFIPIGIILAAALAAAGPEGGFYRAANAAASRPGAVPGKILIPVTGAYSAVLQAVGALHSTRGLNPPLSVTELSPHMLPTSAGRAGDMFLGLPADEHEKIAALLSRAQQQGAESTAPDLQTTEGLTFRTLAVVSDVLKKDSVRDIREMPWDRLIQRFASIWDGVQTAPKAVSIHLGGTIAMSESDGGRGRPDARRLKLKQRASMGAGIVMFNGGIDSSQILLPDLAAVAKAVKVAIAEGYAPVITQGSDSLDAAGLILSQLFPRDFMVLTAAFHPYFSPNSDGPANYRDALLLSRFKKCPGIPQVPYAVMNGAVYLASSLVKLDIDFKDGRRGFGSYMGPVARITEGVVIWDPAFLSNFEKNRAGALEKSRPIREMILRHIDEGEFRFGDAEIAYVNEHTPREYIHAVLGRLRRGQSQGAVFHGVFPASRSLLAELKTLRSQGKPVYVQSFSGRGLKALLFPKGMEPFQLLYKLNVFLTYAGNLSGLDRLLRQNIAGEISIKLANENLSLDIEKRDFYRAKNISRSFVLYHQNYRLMKAALIDEILRLQEESAKGLRAELIIEGLGNGHIYIGRQAVGRRPRASGKRASLRDKLHRAKSLTGILAVARTLGIEVTITTRVKDAVPNLAYDVGRRLAEPDIRAHLSPLPGRTYLKFISR